MCHMEEERTDDRYPLYPESVDVFAPIYWLGWDPGALAEHIAALDEELDEELD